MLRCREYITQPEVLTFIKPSKLPPVFHQESIDRLPYKAVLFSAACRYCYGIRQLALEGILAHWGKFLIVIALLYGLVGATPAGATPVGATPPPGDSLRHPGRYWAAIGVGYGLVQTGLYAAWYRSQESQSFQFFDDAAQWKQVDKVGHYYTAFHLSQASALAFRRSGISPKRSDLYGSIAGSLLLLPTEVFDGFSAAYGFSWHDLAANAAGSVFFMGQRLLWQEVRIHPKFSFQRTRWASERPGTLGSNLAEEVLKDYNGQTYWWSVDLYAFLKKRHPNFPKWINVAVGYGAEQMVHARSATNRAAGYRAYREFYLTVDIDLHHYRRPPTTFGNRLWNGLLYAINLVHLPAPAVSYRPQRGWVFYPLYF